MQRKGTGQAKEIASHCLSAIQLQFILCAGLCLLIRWVKNTVYQETHEWSPCPRPLMAAPQPITVCLLLYVLSLINCCCWTHRVQGTGEPQGQSDARIAIVALPWEMIDPSAYLLWLNGSHNAHCPLCSTKCAITRGDKSTISYRYSRCKNILAVGLNGVPSVKWPCIVFYVVWIMRA